MKILYFGYSYSHAVITSKNNEKREELDYHEFNFVPIKLGSNLSLFSFHIGAGLAILWENALYLKLQLKNSADIFKIGVIIPMDIGIQFADFIGIYAEYKPAIMPITSYKPFVKHSLNECRIFFLYTMLSLGQRKFKYERYNLPRKRGEFYNRRTERPYRKTTKTDKFVTVCTNTHFWSRYKV